MKVLNAVYWVIALALVPLTFLVGGVSLLAYWDIPSAIIVFGMAYLVSFAAHGAGGVFAAYRVASRGGAKGQLLAAVAVFKGLQRNMLLAGIFGVITGSVAMLNWTGDPPVDLAKGVAVCILTGLYSVVGILLLVSPWKSRAAALAAEADK